MAFSRAGWLGLALQDGEKEEGRGEHPFSLCGSIPCFINGVAGRSVDTIVFGLFLLWKVGVPREHSVSQEEPGT